MSLTDDSCCVSVFDFIPEPDQAAIRARTSTVDMTQEIQSAIDHVANGGGGCVCLPAGTYPVNGTIQLKKNVTLEGAGKRGSILRHTGSGNCLESLWPINSATPVDIRVRSLGIINYFAGNSGAGIYEQGGMYVAFEDLLIENFKYGIVLNQSELVDIDLCTIQIQTFAAIWLVNGGDITPEAGYGYTNRISVTRCEINIVNDFHPTNPQGYGILDDGGVCHAFRDNNFNGSITHIRAAGVTNLLISGGEFEGAEKGNLLLDHTRLSGAAIGACGAVLVENCEMVPKNGRPVIDIRSCVHLSLVGNGFGNSGDIAKPLIVGMFNANMVTELGTATETIGPMFDHPGASHTRLYSTTAALFGSAAYDPPSLAAGASGPIQTMTVTGIQPGDAVEDVSFSASSAGVVFQAWVSAANTVSYFARNVGANAEDLASGIVRVKVRRRVF
ncbi:MAG TPA: glycosyl hydrolase family 28-related protein [Allosphingosinicella sp.]|jgi:hypothetical protein